ncbi:MAG: UvrB/UvrC motif-containing protein [Planctomycetota bacterium]
MTYARFRETELLGCPGCYKAFEPQLTPLLGRTHEGGTHHVGKVPKRALALSRQEGSLQTESVLGDAETRSARIAHLRHLLDQALRAEHYEQAARLRDQIGSLEAGDPDAS